jgi:hypothetical protein
LRDPAVFRSAGPSSTDTPPARPSGCYLDLQSFAVKVGRTVSPAGGVVVHHVLAGLAAGQATRAASASLPEYAKNLSPAY